MKATPTNLLRHMKANGWAPSEVWDGEDYEDVSGEQETLGAVQSVDYSNVIFQKDGERQGTVAVILSNGDEFLTDWSPATGDFNATLDAYLKIID